MVRQINPDYARFEREPVPDRRAAFEAAAARLGANAQAIEKDYWVCRTIDALFKGLGPNTRPKLYFKGGTSLSKGHGLIHRFSEDIDIVLSREGLRLDEDPLDAPRSRRKAVVQAVFAKARARLHGPMRERLAAALPSCTIEIYEPETPSSSSLAVRYRSVLPPDPYLKPHVEVQCGARGDPEPYDDLPITPYVQSVLRPGWRLGSERVSIVRPERTFLEKLFLIHAEAIAFEKGAGKADLNRRSRHYYDVAVMHDRKIAAKALADGALLDRVRANQHVMWGKSRAIVDSARPGAFKIMPPRAMRSALARDYADMQNMMFGSPPDFEWVLSELEKLDQAVNRVLL